MKFNYAQYPCEAYFVDGEHDYEHPFHEITEALKNTPKIIIAHDCDVPEVWDAFTKAVKLNGENYELFRVTDTSIAYATRK